MGHRPLYEWLEGLLGRMYGDQPKGVDRPVVQTLALLLTGLFLGPHVQLFALAMNVPVDVQLNSIVRRFERYLANKQVNVKTYFAPFVQAMRNSLGQETAYLIIDCTKAGTRCRTLFIGLAYHGTVLPVVWKSVSGNKGHVTSTIHKNLLEEVYPLFQQHPRVVVLGDAEFSNGPVIKWLTKVEWKFVFRFQNNYTVQLEKDGRWYDAQTLVEKAKMKAGECAHWENICFMESHEMDGLTMTVQWGVGHEKPLLLISNLSHLEQPEIIYEMRYWVETLFSNEKSRGFQLARTHLTIPEQIDRLMLAIAMATCILLGLGTQLMVTEQTNLVDRRNRRDLSLFQLGWRWLCHLAALGDLRPLTVTLAWDQRIPAPGPQVRAA